MNQKIIVSTEIKKQLSILCEKHGIKKILLVCDSAFSFLKTKEEYLSIDIPYVIFNEFTPNPLYEDVVKGVNCFKENKCDAILAIGGGSAIDVAKCIKLYSTMDDSKLYLEQEYLVNDVVLIAIPTTSGTGSESTRYAVIYYEGKKQSVTHESIVPSYALLDYRNLTTLPLYQKKCTMMDALCQAVESWWSVCSDDKCKVLAKEAIELIVKYGDSYIFENTDESAKKIMQASNLAGQAINITATTAPHAMSYKLTTFYGLPHGHSVAVSLFKVWDYMINHLELCTDKRGKEYLLNTFYDISEAFGAKTPEEAVKTFGGILKKYELSDPVSKNKSEDLPLLAGAVNVERLGKNPVALTYEALYGLYDSILKEGNI